MNETEQACRIKQYKNAAHKAAILDSYDKLLDAWGVPVQRRDVQTRYGVTRVNCAGDERLPPLVLLHGVGDDSALMWVYNAKALCEGMRLYAVDTIGGPGRSVPNAAYGEGFDDALWLDDVLDGLGLSQADVAGVSHGGYLAQMYAIRRPDRVRKIACLSVAVSSGERKGSIMKTMRIFLPEAAFPTRANAVRLLKKLSGDNAAAFTDNPLILEHFTALLKGYQNMTMRPHKVLSFEASAYDALRPRALFLAGDRDPFMTMGGKATIERMNMNARFYPTAGHGLNHELPDEINGALLKWFLE